MDSFPNILETTKPHLYLGLDFSTQQVKAVVINENLNVLHEAAVQFDNDLPEFRTYGGVKKQGTAVTAPTVMWIKALDILLDKLKITGLDFNDVAAVSGAGQQHGSVYWRNGAEEILSNLNPAEFMYTQLANCFSVTDSPVWMDSSTRKQCEALEFRVGGAQVILAARKKEYFRVTDQKLADITGSRAYERFTGNQISKIFEEKQELYNNTERISLVSSFACSLFCGKYAPVDWSDGSGMNLLDIKSKDWSSQCLHLCAPDLYEKLGKPVPSQSVVGKVSQYMVDRHGFNPECQVVAFTGDNPASLAGMNLQPGDVAISLGTSDTVFLWLDKPTPSLEGHVFCNPVDPDAYMALLCFKNGSLVRERIKSSLSDKSWDHFNELLKATPPGNQGNIGMYFDEEEITPGLQGVFRFNSQNEPVDCFDEPAVEVRALVEGQFLAKAAHAQLLGFTFGPETRILATGGASQNPYLLQVLSDVFNAPVYIQESANSACLGSAYRALHSLKCPDQFVPFNKTIQRPESFRLASKPCPNASEIYERMIERYLALEKHLLAEKNSAL